MAQDQKYWPDSDLIPELLKQLPSQIFWKNTNSIYLGCNDAFAHAMGLASPEEIVGKSDFDLPTTEEESIAFRADDKVIMRSGPKLNIEETQTFPDGRKVHLLTSKVPLLNKNKEVVGILGIYIDITEKKQLELALKETNHKLENILNTIPGHVFWKDINGVYLGANKLMVTNAGCESNEDIIGKTDYDLVWKEQADTLGKVDQQVMQTQTPITLEETATLKDGATRTFLSNKVPLYENGNVTGILGISLDITQHKETLEKLRKTEDRLEGMTTISSTLAHELRTPLRTIISAANGIKKYLPQLVEVYDIAKKANLPLPAINPRHAGMLVTACENIESEAQASFTVINILLTNLKASSSKGLKIENPKTCSIKESVNEALRRYPFDIDEEALVKWGDNQDFEFKSDPSLITHVMFNLLKNALYQIKAINKGHIEIWTELGQDYNSLHFKDTAKGIPAEDVPHIFDRFFTKTYHGAGIGLAFCKIAMESVGGKIECRSKEGEFAEFILYFPTKLAENHAN